MCLPPFGPDTFLRIQDFYKLLIELAWEGQQPRGLLRVVTSHFSGDPREAESLAL